MQSIRNRKSILNDSISKPKERVTAKNATPLLSCKRQCPIIIASFLIMIIISYNMSKSFIIPISFDLPPLPYLVGPLAINGRLTFTEKLHFGKFKGAESIVSYKGALYTGVVGGKILKINDTGVHLFASFGQPNCSSVETCGRPLGMRLDEKRNRLLVADAYLGIFAVSLDDGNYTHIFPKDNSLKVTFFDDLDILPDGRIIVSEASLRFQLHHFIYDILEGSKTGRVLIINPEYGTWSVLADNLFFPNGIQVHSDKKSVLIAETGRSRIMRAFIDGVTPITVFCDGLPGLPDNIRPSSRGGYWVPLTSIRYVEAPSMMDRLAKWPYLRYVIHKMMSIPLIHMFMLKKHTIVTRVDDAGHIVESLHDTTGNILNVAEAIDHDGYLYTGSYFLPFIGRVKLSDL